MPIDMTSDLETAAELPPRSVWTALKRGMLCRCPACGKGRLFRGYLTVAEQCDACGEDLTAQRADDAPPSFTIVIVGHIMVPLVLMVERNYAPAIWLQMAIWIPLTILLSLFFLRPIKGMVVGYQWASYMHGFDTRSRADGAAEPAE